MITLELTEEEADMLFTGLTNSVDEMAEEIERLTNVEKTFDRIRNKIRSGQNEN